MNNYSMGYSPNMRDNHIERKDSRSSSKYGDSYDRYQENKRYYTSSKDPEDQRKMKESIEDIFNDMEDIVKDVWGDLDAADRQKIKAKMTQVVQKMQ